MENIKNENYLDNVRHSASHLLAAAVIKLWPDTKLGIGPTIKNGFYYDFSFKKPISEEDLPKIEAEMKKILKTWDKFTHIEKSIEEAKKIEANQPFKLDLIRELCKTTNKVSFYKSGNFIDLCKGDHVDNAKDIGPFKLLTIAGAYWRGSENNPMLTRIYGTCFITQEELDNYLKQREEAKNYDHRRIGRELDLFSFHNEAPGFVFWHPKGMLLREALMGFYNKLQKSAGYQLVSTPILLSEELWHRSGHWENYRDKMYFVNQAGKKLVLKPMNCPGMILIYKERPHSYRDLPIRLAEMGEVHRYEQSGTLNGLFRVRAFRQDDAHIFATEDQIESEIKNIIDLTLRFYKILGFPEVSIELSTRPEKSMGNKKTWDKAENTLKKVLNNLKLNYKINEGEGAFYGPKIDFHINDSLSRSWQCGTIQLDLFMPEKFNLTYTDSDGKPRQPAMIHRTIIGSLQRFVGVLVEHFGGAFPLWLSPIQAIIIPIAERHNQYATELRNEFLNKKLRIEVDSRNETMQTKIRDAELQKIPYMLVVGDREQVQKKVAVRSRGKGDEGSVLIGDLINRLEKEVENRE
ncbi:MAG: threonine--tRNA ligase [Candidatus Woykebacteria bacterium RBG_13_40_15]|uniref:Threonine--tRNA ligase n=1 Tax=Candidatus Woykebacteria bacterium RBG_13_40_15 TaxID=1802593 RepID=A0A1G1W6Z7_9BACT|nr:MAG: threonine--tRNA ligase [Candidatus Woykebacteria bacterium RBG_13_40_15]